MKRNLSITLAALTIGALGATASAQPYPDHAPAKNRDNVVDKRDRGERHRRARRPVITAVPDRVKPGEKLVITGRFMPARAFLQLGSTRLKARRQSSDRLVFGIPDDLPPRTYRARLKVAGQNMRLGRITVLEPYYAPEITSIPSRATIGKQLVITGRHLPEDAVLRIGRAVLKPSWNNGRRMSFEIPRSLRPRIYPIKLMTARGNKHLGRIVIERPYHRPQVRWNPSSVRKGKSLTITGRYLPVNAVLEIGRYRLRAYRSSDHRLEFKVPRTMRSGRYRMKLVSPRHTESLGLVRVRPERHRYRYGGWNGFWSGSFGFHFGS